MATTPRLLVQAFLPQIMVASSLGPAKAGLLLSAQTTFAVATILLFPSLERKFGSMRLLSIAGALLTIATLAPVLCTTFTSLLTIFSLFGGVGWAILSLRGPQELVNRSPEYLRAEYLAAVTKGPIAANLLVPTLALLLATAIDWRVIIVFVAISLVATIPPSIRSLLALIQPRFEYPSSRVSEAEFRPERASTFLNMALSGLLTGTVHTHLIVIATTSPKGFAELACWSLFFGAAALFSTYAWTPAANRGLLRQKVSEMGLLAGLCGVAASVDLSNRVALIALVGLPIYAVGLYTLAMFVSKHDVRKQKITGYLVITHMASAAAGALICGVLAEVTGSYRLPILFIAGLCLINALSEKVRTRLNRER